MDYKEELKFQKRERDMIKSEINNLQSRIIAASGRNNRFEVNHCRERINRLKMKLNEVSQKISELEKISRNGQITLVPNDLSFLQNGEVDICDIIEFDRDYYGTGGEVIETVVRTIERKVTYKRGKPVSSIETMNEKVTR